MRRKENSSETHKTKRYYEISSDTIEKLNKQCYDYKAENDTLIDDLVWYKAKVNKLERENEFLRQLPELQLTKDSSAQGLPFIEEDK